MLRYGCPLTQCCTAGGHARVNRVRRACCVGQTLGQSPYFRQSAPEIGWLSRVCGVSRVRVNPPSCVCVYTSRMKPVVTTRWAPNAVEQVQEIEDFDAVVRLYWPRVFRYAGASLRDRDAAESLAQ